MKPRAHATLAFAAMLLVAFAGTWSELSCSSTDLVADAGRKQDARVATEAEVPDGAVPCPVIVPPNDDVSQLPQGKPCAPDSPACSLSLTSYCGDPGWTHPGSTDGWECVCKDEAWDCVITSLGEGTCGGDSGDDAGPPCGSNLPYRPPEISEECDFCVYQTVEGGLDPCFADYCKEYFNCRYCGCYDGGGYSASCQEGCGPRPPACENCYALYAEGANGVCASKCAGQPYLDAGFVDARVTDPEGASPDGGS